MRNLSEDTKLITRAEWDARSPTSITPFTADYGSTVHYNGPAIGLDRLIGNHGACYSTWRGIQNFHMDGQGWTDIAYTSGACPHGFVFEGRWIGRRTAAQGTNEGNGSAYAIFAFLGQGENPPDMMKRAIVDCARYLRAHGGAGPGLNSHRDWHSTACPGDPLNTWVKDGAPRPAAVDVFPLKPGDEGFAVVLLEIILVHSGFIDILVDGKFGGNTMDAVHEMQRFLKLGQRDLVREEDFEAFRNWSNMLDFRDRPKTISDHGPQVDALLDDLKRARKIPASTEKYDVNVQEAMREIQRFCDAKAKAGNCTMEEIRFVHDLVNNPTN